MTTFVRSRRNDNVLIGFFVLVLAGAVVRTATSGSTMLAVICGVLAVGLVGVGVRLASRPPSEIRVSPAEITYWSKLGSTLRIGHDEANGRVTVDKQVHRGHASFSLVDAAMATGTSIPLDGFRLPPGALATACADSGWELVD